MVPGEARSIPGTSHWSELIFAPSCWDSVLITYHPEKFVEAQLFISKSSCSIGHKGADTDRFFPRLDLFPALGLKSLQRFLGFINEITSPFSTY